LESKSTFFILIIIVAVLALSLAALAGYLFIVQGGQSNENAVTGEKSEIIPSEDELIKISLFNEARYFNLKKSSDNSKSSIIQANVTLKCYKKLKNNKKAVVEELVAARTEEIQELVVRFFMTLTSEDVKDLDVMDAAKENLTKQINELMNEGVEKPEDVVYRVVFSEWLFQ